MGGGRTTRSQSPINQGATHADESLRLCQRTQMLMRLCVLFLQALRVPALEQHVVGAAFSAGIRSTCRLVEACLCSRAG